MFAAIIGVRGFDRLTSSANLFDAAVVFLRPSKAAHDQDSEIEEIEPES